jgi:hypothetical protein
MEKMKAIAPLDENINYKGLSFGHYLSEVVGLYTIWYT